MGPPQRLEPKLFYAAIRPDDRIPPGHVLRRIAAIADFGSVRHEAAGRYGHNGNVSIDPVALVKLMLLLLLEDGSSEEGSSADAGNRHGFKHARWRAPRPQ
jgi:hypothetical protein